MLCHKLIASTLDFIYLQQTKYTQPIKSSPIKKYINLQINSFKFETQKLMFKN